MSPRTGRGLSLLLFILVASCSSKKEITPDQIPVEAANGTDKETENAPQKLVPMGFGADGYPKLKKFFRSGDSLTKVEADFNGDGRVDFIQVFDPAGHWVEKESADLNGDGNLDVTYTYRKEAGAKDPELALQEFDTRYEGQTSVWKHYKNGQLAKRELDRRGRGKPDYWEYYEDRRLVRIDRDENLDGLPDFQPRFKQIVRPSGPEPGRKAAPASQKPKS